MKTIRFHRNCSENWSWIENDSFEGWFSHSIEKYSYNSVLSWKGVVFFSLIGLENLPTTHIKLMFKVTLSTEFSQCSVPSLSSEMWLFLSFPHNFLLNEWLHMFLMLQLQNILHSFYEILTENLSSAFNELSKRLLLSLLGTLPKSPKPEIYFCYVMFWKHIGTPLKYWIRKKVFPYTQSAFISVSAHCFSSSHYVLLGRTGLHLLSNLLTGLGSCSYVPWVSSRWISPVPPASALEACALVPGHLGVPPLNSLSFLNVFLVLGHKLEPVFQQRKTQIFWLCSFSPPTFFL